MTKLKTTTPSRYVQKETKLRKQIFGDIAPEQVWHRKRNDGFTTIPRTMPLIGAIMDGLSGKGKPVARTYLELWCRSNDDGFVKLGKAAEIAFASGFTTQRGVSTWKERIRSLEKLGFLATKPGVSGELHYVQLWNPYLIIKNHHNSKTPGFLIDHYNALFERVLDIGAKDLDE